MQTFLHEKFQAADWSNDAEQILRACVHCGFCTAVCSTYQLTGDESESPRGRIYLIHSILHDNPVSLTTQQHLDNCLTCRACEAMCPSGVKYSQLLDIGKILVEQQVKRSFWQRLQRHGLALTLPYPQRMRWLLPLVRVFNPVLPKSMRLVEHKNSQFNLDLPSLPASQPKVLLLNGCVQSVLAPQINQATEFVLHKLGVTVIKTNFDGCCGALAYHLQKHELGLEHARRQIDNWWEYINNNQQIATIIITASGCGSFVKEYANILAQDSEYAHKAALINNLTRDLAEFIQPNQLQQFNLPPISDKIAVHTPCSLQHVQKLPNNVGNLVRALGYKTVSVEAEHLCCGSAGSYSLLQPKIAHELKLRKLNYLQAEQPDLIATANIGCLAHLAQDAKVPVLHWVQLAAKRLELIN